MFLLLPGVLTGALLVEYAQTGQREPTVAETVVVDRLRVQSSLPERPRAYLNRNWQL